MTMKNEEFNDIEKFEVIFEKRDSTDTLFDRFSERAESPDMLVLFFNVTSACALKFEILRSASKKKMVELHSR
jgi:hypothetical protein